MAITIQPPQPGDLITSDYFKRLIDQLAALDARIAALEGGTAPGKTMVIFSPLAADTLHIGDELRIFGQGFGIPTLSSVLIDDIHEVTTFKGGSSDNLLILDIPTFLVPPSGKLVNLKVSNNVSVATSSFTLLPALANLPAGLLAVGLTQSPAAVTAPGADLVFSASANTNLDEDYVVTVNLTPPVSPPQPAGWNAFLADVGGNRITPSEVSIPKGATRPFRIRVVIPAGASGAAKLSTTVASKRNPSQLTQSSGIINLNVNGAPPVVDQIKVQFSLVFAGDGKLKDGEIRVPAGIETEIDFLAQLPAKGDYTVSLPSFAAGTNPAWSSRIKAGASFKGASGQVTIKAAVTPPANAQPTSVTVHMSSDTDPNGTVGNQTLPIRAI